MDTRTQDRVEGWDARSFSDGFDGLRDLADDEFTGAVEGDGRFLFMLNGRIVGVFDGSIDDFEDASGTAYRAPDPALVMLCTMWETGGKKKAEYYTNETPIEEVDSTLKSGSFTGFVELSENVLSGDYYVCYYGGRSLPVAFVGNSEQLLTGNEAFERANDEVGIYEVRTVDVEVVDIPSPDPPEEPDEEEETADGRTGGAAVPDAAESPDPSDSDADADERSDATADSDAEADDGPAVTANIRAGDDPAGDDDADATPEDVVAAPPPESDRESTTDTSAADATATDAPATDTSATDTSATDATGADPDAESRSSRPSSPERSRESTDQNRTSGPDRSGDRSRTEGTTDDPLGRQDDGRADASTSADRNEPRFEREEEWRETTTIPSIDPDNSAEAEENHAPNGAGGTAGGTTERGTGRSTGRPGSSGGRPGGSEPLEREMLEREDKIDRLQQQVSDLQAERDELEAERRRLRSAAEEAGDAEELREEKERLETQNGKLRERIGTLESEVESLEAEVDRLESALEEARAAQPEDDAPSGRQLSRAAALSGTNLFVRYGSKGEDTLENAHSGTATKEDVNGNLRLEHHTNFDANDAVVDGHAYEGFLPETIEYGFVDWIVRTLLFEIRDTGNQDALRDLYDTLPEVDRAELDGVVELDGDGDAEERPDEIGFDVVLRNRMGAPLIVANVNDSRDPATEEMMVELNEHAGAVKELHDEFVGAFMVTTSFFAPGALETADEATSGSFLSRDSRKSFVKQSRKHGYHLCLVETRNGNFHVNVPEL